MQETVITTNIAAAKVGFESVARIDTASPDSSRLIQTGLIRLWGLNAIEPEAFVEIHPEDMYALGAQDGDLVRVSSRRGTIVLKARIGVRTQQHARRHAIRSPAVYR